MSRPKTVHPATVHPEPPLQKRHGMTSTAPLPQLAGLPGFPLPLTAFEEYLLRDGSPAAPLEFFFRIHLGRELSRAVLATATAAAACRHPLLLARILDDDKGPPVFSFRHPPTVDSLVVEVADATCPQPLSTPASPLVRLMLSRPTVTGEQPAGAIILAQFHHVATDGLGAVAFLEDLLAEIARLQAEPRQPQSRLRRLEPSLLLTRGHYGLSLWRLLKMLPDQAVGLAGIRQFFQNRPLQLGAQSAQATDHPTLLTDATFSLPPSRTEALRHAAAAADVSVNELAATAIFQAVAPLCRKMQSTQSATRPDVVRLCVPMNLRRASDRKMPATNLCSMVFLDRTPSQIAAGPLSLLQSIHDEMALIRRHGLGLTFIFSLLLGRRLPGGIRGVVAGQPAAATVLFTNVGKVFRRRRTDAAQALPLVTAVEGLAPLRRDTPLAITATEHAGQLAFTFRYDHSQLTPADVAAAVRRFDEALENVAKAAASQSVSLRPT